MDRLVMGIDSSTQSTTVEVRVVDTGESVATASAPHPPTTPPRSETDPDAWWQALVSATAQIGELRSQIDAVSVAGQQHGLVALDEAHQVIRPAKLWNDTESAPQAEWLVDRLGADAWAQSCGLVPVASFTISKLAWLVENEPDNAERLSFVMLPHDWLTWRLTGRHVTDRGDASGTGWFDPATNRYRPELLALIGEGDWERTLPQVLSTTEEAGRLDPEPAAELGLRPGTVVGPGTGDNMASALGLGLRHGDVAVSLGTSGTAFAVSTSPTFDPSGVVAGFADATGSFLPLVCTLNATKVTDTIARWMGSDRAEFARLALEAPAGSDGLVVVPYFDGERTPNRPDATGLMGGIRTGTTRQALARAAHEGVVCGLMDGVEALRSAGVDASGRLLLTGGGARSPAYRQIAADLSGRPVVVPDVTETVTAGACLQAASVLTATAPMELAAAWGLGSGTAIEPTIDSDEAAAIRSRYADIAALSPDG